MNSPASIRSHPIHPMLIAFPIGLWIFSLFCDLIYLAGPHNVFWKEVAFYTMAGGVVGALLAAVPGFIAVEVPSSKESKEQRRVA